MRYFKKLIKILFVYLTLLIYNLQIYNKYLYRKRYNVGFTYF